MAFEDLPPPPADAVLLPAVGVSAFVDTWRGLRELPRLFVPWRLRSEVGETAPSESDLFDHIDTGGSIYDDGQRRIRIGIALTDPRFLVPDVILGALPTATALRRFFHADQLDGLSWNPCDERSACRTTGHVVLRFGLPRLIGLAESADPLASGAAHGVLAERSLRGDHVYAAHHHAAAAREQDAPLDSFFFTELDTLRRLALWPEFQSYREWYARKGGRRTRRVGLYAAGAVASGQPAEPALQLTAGFLDDPELAPRAWLERGRALYALGRPAEAVDAFDRSLALEAGSCETLVGKGIALRALHWSSGQPEGLRAAAACFEEVRRLGDFEVAEATHHLATIHLALGDWPRVEALSREAMRLRKSMVSRRNLCLALHAQGRIDEASREYRFLVEHAPDQAEPLHKYFTS